MRLLQQARSLGAAPPGGREALPPELCKVSCSSEEFKYVLNDLKPSSDWLVRLLAPADKCPPLRELPSNTHQPTPRPRDPSKTSSDASSSSSRLGPSWLTDKPSTPPSVSSSSSPRPVSGLSPKPPTSQTTAGSTVTPRPTPAPRTSATAAKTLQSKIQFFQSDDTSQERETSTSSGTGTVQLAPAAQPGTITVKVGQKDLRSVEEKPKASGVAGRSGKGSESTSKAQAAAFISRKLTEENNNKPSWTNVVLKKTDK